MYQIFVTVQLDLQNYECNITLCYKQTLDIAAEVQKHYMIIIFIAPQSPHEYAVDLKCYDNKVKNEPTYQFDAEPVSFAL